MSERTFRAVVAAVLVGALVLAVVVAVAALYRPAPPSPSPSAGPSRAPTPAPSPTATPFAGPVFVTPGIVSVGLVERGSSSSETLVLEFVESQVDAIPNAPGSFVVRLADHAADPSTVTFIGTPSVFGPGSLGATVALAGPNALLISIAASDPLNIEGITIRGLGIGATPDARTGPIRAEASDFSGSLERALADDLVGSPGSVVEAR